jgi:hypothetical protein
MSSVSDILKHGSQSKYTVQVTYCLAASKDHILYVISVLPPVSLNTTYCRYLQCRNIVASNDCMQYSCRISIKVLAALVTFAPAIICLLPFAWVRFACDVLSVTSAGFQEHLLFD